MCIIDHKPESGVASGSSPSHGLVSFLHLLDRERKSNSPTNASNAWNVNFNNGNVNNNNKNNTNYVRCVR